MCKFILQEANEKANEIRIKTEHDFHKDKQLRVIAANQKTDEHFEQQKIRLESDKKVRHHSKTSWAACMYTHPRPKPCCLSGVCIFSMPCLYPCRRSAPPDHLPPPPPPSLVPPGVALQGRGRRTQSKGRNSTHYGRWNTNPCLGGVGGTSEK
jgi:hypothetical protein